MENCKNTSIDKHQSGSMPHECLECIEWLNWVRLMIVPRSDNSIASNQEVAINYVKKFLHECDLQEVFLAQKRHEAIAAACSLIYNERIIKGKIADPKELERAGWKSPPNLPESSSDWKRAEKEMRERNRPKVEKKQLTQFEKAVEQLVNVGVSEKDAESIVKERFAKQGKVTQ